MNIQELEKLAKLLEADANNPKGLKFDIGTVAESEGGSILWEPGLNCGTSGCAMGLVALSSEFPGINYRIHGGMIQLMMDGEDTWYDDAAVKLFDINVDIANKLFNPDYYPDDKQTGSAGELEVVARIRKLIAQGNLDDIKHYELH